MYIPGIIIPRPGIFFWLKTVILFTFAPLFVLSVPIGGYALYTKATGNYHEVVPYRVFRSAQLNAQELETKVKQSGIKSILNLRGKNPGKSWYKEEMAFCESHGIAHYDIPLSARNDPTPEQIEEIISIFRNAPRPLLIHCQAGADRTGFAAALYHMVIEGRPVEEADDELTIWYGHIPLITPQVIAMDRTLYRYAESLKEPEFSKAAANLTIM